MFDGAHTNIEKAYMIVSYKGFYQVAALFTNGDFMSNDHKKKATETFYHIALVFCLCHILYRKKFSRYV